MLNISEGLIRAGVKSEHICIAVAYLAQARAVREQLEYRIIQEKEFLEYDREARLALASADGKAMDPKELNPVQYRQIKITTVDGSAGQEYPVVLFGLTNADQLRFLSDEERFTVAFTRAQASLIIVGNSRIIAGQERRASQVLCKAIRILQARNAFATFAPADEDSTMRPRDMEGYQLPPRSLKTRKIREAVDKKIEVASLEAQLAAAKKTLKQVTGFGINDDAPADENLTAEATHNTSDDVEVQPEAEDSPNDRPSGPASPQGTQGYRAWDWPPSPSTAAGSDKNASYGYFMSGALDRADADSAGHETADREATQPLRQTSIKGKEVAPLSPPWGGSKAPSSPPWGGFKDGPLTQAQHASTVNPEKSGYFAKAFDEFQPRRSYVRNDCTIFDSKTEASGRKVDDGSGKRIGSSGNWSPGHIEMVGTGKSNPYPIYLSSASLLLASTKHDETHSEKLLGHFLAGHTQRRRSSSSSTERRLSLDLTDTAPLAFNLPKNKELTGSQEEENAADKASAEAQVEGQANAQADTKKANEDRKRKKNARKKAARKFRKQGGGQEAVIEDAS